MSLSDIGELLTKHLLLYSTTLVLSFNISFPTAFFPAQRLTIVSLDIAGSNAFSKRSVDA
jgi:hypothetical protein